MVNVLDSNCYYYEYLININFISFFFFELVILLDIELEILFFWFKKVYGLYLCFICVLKCVKNVILLFLVEFINFFV